MKVRVKTVNPEYKGQFSRKSYPVLEYYKDSSVGVIEDDRGTKFWINLRTKIEQNHKTWLDIQSDIGSVQLKR